MQTLRSVQEILNSPAVDPLEHALTHHIPLAYKGLPYQRPPPPPSNILNELSCRRILTPHTIVPLVTGDQKGEDDQQTFQNLPPLEQHSPSFRATYHYDEQGDYNCVHKDGIDSTPHWHLATTPHPFADFQPVYRVYSLGTGVPTPCVPAGTLVRCYARLGKNRPKWVYGRVKFWVPQSGTYAVHIPPDPPQPGHDDSLDCFGNDGVTYMEPTHDNLYYYSFWSLRSVRCWFQYSVPHLPYYPSYVA